MNNFFGLGELKHVFPMTTRYRFSSAKTIFLYLTVEKVPNKNERKLVCFY